MCAGVCMCEYVCQTDRKTDREKEKEREREREREEGGGRERFVGGVLGAVFIT